MKKTLFFLLTVGLICTINAQETINLKVTDDAAQHIKKGSQLADNGKFEEALNEYNQIPYGDMYYEHAQYEKAYVLELSKDYNGAIAILNDLLKNPNCSVSLSDIYSSLGNCYDYLGQTDKSIAAYDKAIEAYPYYYHLHFNKGVTLMGANRYEEALECFKESIFLNPSHQGSHYRYGLCNLKLGYTVPGLLALNFCNLINTGSGYGIESLRELDAVYTNGVKLYNEDNKIEISSKYEELNEFYSIITNVLNTTLASSKQFKNQSKVDHLVVKSNQIVFNNIKVRPGSHEIEDMLYAPFFSKIMQEKKFNTLAFYQFGSTNINNGKVQQKAQKMSSQFQALIQDIIKQIQESSAKGLAQENPNGYTYLYNDNFVIQSWGKMEPDATGKEVKEGTWYEISDNGQIEAIVNYKHGLYYGNIQIYEDGVIAQEAPFKDNKISGRAHIYTVDPISHEKIDQMIFDMDGGVPNGLHQEFNYGGVLVMDANVGSDGVDGEIRYYDEQGNLKAIETYKDGEQSGLMKGFFANGKTLYEYIAGGKDERTNYTSYYATGKVEEEGPVMNNKRVGTWRSYNPDGSLQDISEYNDNGEEHGYFVSYKGNHKDFSGKKQNGSMVEYTTYGNVYGKPETARNFKNGQLVSVTTLYPDSTIRETYPVKNKSVTFDYYSELGWKLSTLTLNANNEYNGKQTTYFPNGAVSREYEMKNGEQTGVEITYYSNGLKRSYYNYKNNAANGICVKYYNNEGNTISEEGYFRNDTLCGASYAYFENGNISEIYLRDNAGVLVHHQSFRANGTLRGDCWYNNGIPYISTFCDLDGNPIKSDTIYFGNGAFNSYYANGAIEEERTIKAGNTIGTIYNYDLDHNITDSVMTINGNNHGKFVSHYPNGKLQGESNLILGNPEGTVIHYDEFGHKSSESHYENGQRNGIAKYYTHEGKLCREYNYHYGTREGKSLYYAPDGKTVLLEIVYEYNQKVTYSYSQKGGAMSEPAMIGNQPLKVTAYYANGSLGAVFNFNNGEFDGTTTYYYPNGHAYESIELKDGNYNGTCIIYYANGKIYEKANYKDDNKQGSYQLFYENGQPYLEANFAYDELDGTYTCYDNKGNVTLVKTYLNGELVPNK